MLYKHVDLFCPYMEIVMGGYCGSMTTLVASIQSRRQCVRIEYICEDFTAASHRLRECFPRTTHTDTTPRVSTKDSSIVKFEEGIKADENDANLLLSILTYEIGIPKQPEDVEVEAKIKRNELSEDNTEQETVGNKIINGNDCSL